MPSIRDMLKPDGSIKLNEMGCSISMPPIWKFAQAYGTNANPNAAVVLEGDPNKVYIIQQIYLQATNDAVNPGEYVGLQWVDYWTSNGYNVAQGVLPSAVDSQTMILTQQCIPTLPGQDLTLMGNGTLKSYNCKLWYVEVTL